VTDDQSLLLGQRQTSAERIARLATSSRENFCDFTPLERHLYAMTKYDPTFEGIRTRVLYSCARSLYDLGFRPDGVSILGAFMAVCASFLLLVSPIISGIFIISSLVLDGFDGVLARANRERLGKRKLDGGLVDVFCDTLGLEALLVGLGAQRIISINVMSLGMTLTLIYVICSARTSKRVLAIYRSLGPRVFGGSSIAMILLLHGSTDIVEIESSFVVVVTAMMLLEAFGIAYYFSRFLEKSKSTVSSDLGSAVKARRKWWATGPEIVSADASDFSSENM